MAEVLILGNGGREDALRQAMLVSAEVNRAEVFEDVRAGLDAFAGSLEKPFVILGSERLAVDGLTDYLRSEGHTVFGATIAASIYEGSKAFATYMMREAGVPHPNTQITTTTAAALEFVDRNDPLKYVIKANGLAAGKGAVLPYSVDYARQVVQDMRSGRWFEGAGQDCILFSDRHSGPEVTAMVVVGKGVEDFVILPLAQDYKCLDDGDVGPNTGGMGAYAPVPESIVSPEQYQDLRKVISLSLRGMKAYGIPYKRAVLYVGAMLSQQKAGKPQVIEYNVRFGDPEAQAVLPLLTASGVDVYRLLRSAAEGKLEKPDIDLSKIALSALTVCLASAGYPNSSRSGDRVYGLDYKHLGVTVQRAGARTIGRDTYTTGGRALSVTAVASDLQTASNAVYSALDLENIGEDSGKIGFAGMQVRRDIGRSLSPS